MEMIIGIVALVCLMILCFFSGVRLSDYYHDRQERAVDYALKRQFARLRAGADADDPVAPYVSRIDGEPQDMVYN